MVCGNKMKIRGVSWKIKLAVVVVEIESVEGWCIEMKGKDLA